MRVDNFAKISGMKSYNKNFFKYKKMGRNKEITLIPESERKYLVRLKIRKQKTSLNKLTSCFLFA